MTRDAGGTASYAYRAVRQDGVAEAGVIQAPSRSAVASLLAARGLFPTEIRIDDGPAFRRRRIPVSELAIGLRLLANLLGAGLPMSRALQAFAEVAPPAWTPALDPLRSAVREGKTLAAALADSPIEIPAVVTGIIRAGEAAGDAAGAVRRTADLMEESSRTRSAIRGALAYPFILAGAGLASLVLLGGVVIPRFAVILADLGQTVPLSTRLVLGASSLMRDAALPLVLGFALLTLAWRAWSATPAGQSAWHRLLLALPASGAVRHAAATATSCASLAALLDTGVPLSHALVHASRASGDRVMAERLLDVRERVLRGERLSRAAEESRALTRTAIRLVRAGEETGRLGAVLAHAAVIEAERARDAVRAAVRLIEPAMILIFGALVALVAASLLQALYSVRPA